MADTLTLKEVELDYEADEVDDVRGDDGTDGTPREEDSTPREETDGKKEENSSPTKEGDTSLDGDKDGPAKNGEEDIESGEELEDGELSDEDETAKNERLEPKPVCRFYSKGQCTWGASCRFMHPGVLDKGNYSMFAPPRPILPGEPEEPAGPVETEPVLIAPPVPVYESAWERGLRQAKEMRRRSAKRKEMDVEYEEKKSSMSLTQIELDKENDYYMRPASPAHTYDPYADDDPTTDPYDTYHPECLLGPTILATELPRSGLRPVVIDGFNVAMCHGRALAKGGRVKFSGRGIEMCVEFFSRRGHSTVVAFLPQHAMAMDRDLLAKMEKEGNVVFTPSRKVGGRRIASYDDRFILEFAHHHGGVIVTRDNYADLYEENPEWRQTIEDMVLMPTWVGDTLMFPADPQGKEGPTLDQLLRNEVSGDKKIAEGWGGGGGYRGRGRGGWGGRNRRNNNDPPPCREDLDKELDEYMAGAKSVLDKELDDYAAQAKV